MLIADSEGNLIESESSVSCEHEDTAALIVEMFNRVSYAVEKLSSDSIENVVIDGIKSRVIIVGDIILGVLADISSNYGLLRIELKKARDKIAAMI